MSGASLLHTQLLHQAKHLAEKEPKHPQQASLRRSISASYYALFHFLTYRAARHLVGTSDDLENLRNLFRRAFNHGEMAGVCRGFQNGLGGLPDPIEDAMSPVEVPEELVGIAEAFVHLQTQRQRADYDLEATFLSQDALRLHGRAYECIKELWPAISDHDATQFFLISLVSWRKIKRR